LWKNSKLAVLLAIVLSASMWFYFQQVLIAFQTADAAAHGRPRGTLSDLYPRWLGSRELILHGRDPYSAQITREIQTGYYGRPIDPSRPDDPKDEQRFAYPPYVAFLLAPFAKLPFATVRIIFMWLLAFITGISVLLWLRVLRWKPSPAITAVLLLMAVNSLPSIQGIKLQQLSLLVGGLIAICAALLSAGHLFLAGVVLALATIKPQITLLPVLWLIVWTVSEWRERQRFLWGFGLALSLLLAASEYVLPGWIPKFLAGLVAYQRYTGGVSQIGVVASPLGGVLLAGFAIAAAVVVCWRLRHVPAGSPLFGVAFAFVLTITVLIVGFIAPYNQVMLFPALLLILRSWSELWSRNRLTRLICLIAAVLVLWPWIVSLALMLAFPFVPQTALRRQWPVPLWSSIGIPVIILPLMFTVVSDAWRSARVNLTCLAARGHRG